MTNNTTPVIVTTSTDLENTGKISIRNMGVCFCAAVCLTGALSPAITPAVAQPIYSSNVSVVSTIPSQTLVYDNGELTVYLTDVGDRVLSEDVRRSLDVLSEISILEDNWDNYGASRFTEHLITQCRDLVRQLRIQPDIFPTVQGSIQFEWENDIGDYLEIEFFENGRHYMASRKRDGSWIEQTIEVSAIGDCVEEFFARTV